MITTCRPGLRLGDKPTFLLGYYTDLRNELDLNGFNPLKLKNKYTGKNSPDENCWLVKSSCFDSDEMNLLQDHNKSSMLI